jgi:hypothetical protein
MMAAAFLLITGAAAGTAAPSVPARANVEWALEWENMRWCRDLIDACLDENGNSTVPEQRWEVSHLRCRPAAPAKATCSFRSLRTTAFPTEPAKRCMATFRLVGRDDENRSWQVDLRAAEGRRIPSIAVMACN